MNRASVLLISPNRERFPAPVYPLALPRLAGALERAGHAARQFDLLAHGAEALPQAVREARPTLVAVSIRNVDNNDSEAPRSYLPDVREAVASVRRETEAPVVLGGSGFSLFPQQFLRELDADYGVVGPGEGALCALADALADGRSPAGIPGLIVRGGAIPDRVEADGTFAPSSHLPDLVAYYWREAGMIGVQTKRGCPRTCSYCSYPLIDGRSVRLADPGAAVGEMAQLFRDHGVRYFFVVDSLFNLEPEHELAFAEELSRLGAPIQWGAFFAPTRQERGYWDALKRSGLTHVELGTDALSDPMLAAYAKGFSVADAVHTTELCAEIGLYCAHYILFGGPGETPETIRETVANAERLPRCVLFPFAGVRVYPRTAVYAHALASGQVRGEADCFEPRFYFAEGLDAPRIWRLVAEAATGRREWVLPSRYPKLAPMMAHLRRSGAKGPLWEFLVT